MDNKNIFASNLKKYMKINKKTRRDICNDLGFSYYTFTDWVNGKKYPRMDKVEILANYFGILKSDLIEDKEENTSINLGNTRKASARVLEATKRWNDEVGETQFTDDEMTELINFANYLISKRKK